MSAKIGKKCGFSFLCWISTPGKHQQTEPMLLSAVHQGHGLFHIVQTASYQTFWTNTPKFILETEKILPDKIRIQYNFHSAGPSATTRLIFWPSCETTKLTHQNLKVQKPYTFSRSLSYHNIIH